MNRLSAIRNRPPRARRGFVFMFVLMVIVVGTIAIGATINAAQFKATVAEQRIQQYKTQHEALSVRDIIVLWIMNQNRSGGSNNRRTDRESPLLALAMNEGATQRFTLQSGVVVSLRVSDAQGTMLARLDETLAPADYEWLFRMLSRLPQDRVDLIRRHGPIQVSLRGASDEVLVSIADNDPDLARALIDARDTGVPDPAGFAQALGSAGIEPVRTQEVLRRIALTPVLWEMQIEVIDPNASRTRRYTMIVEQTSTFPIVHRWGPYIEPRTREVLGR